LPREAGYVQVPRGCVPAPHRARGYLHGLHHFGIEESWCCPVQVVLERRRPHHRQRVWPRTVRRLRKLKGALYGSCLRARERLAQDGERRRASEPYPGVPSCSGVSPGHKDIGRLPFSHLTTEGQRERLPELQGLVQHYPAGPRRAPLPVPVSERWDSRAVPRRTRVPLVGFGRCSARIDAAVAHSHRQRDH
ncbi:hypothetical protein IscW_ISCW012510, partial [Ixodes scapularis]